MPHYLQIAEGENKGQRFEIKAGVSIGRKGTTILLKDSKISSLHALIEERRGEFYIVDQASSNGLRVGGVRKSEFLLKPGMRVQIGRIYLEVIVDTEDLEKPAHHPKPAQAPRPIGWSDVVSNLILRARQKAQILDLGAAVFDPPLSLSFIQGPQAGTNWILGYGPRKAGHLTTDLSLEEPGLPDLCFELKPQGKSALFETREPKVVRLNGRSITSQILKEGDVIEVLSTKITISFQTRE
jgi:pSer/pThr/pTyr-binding forkhead associated (FHA) protein